MSQLNSAAPVTEPGASGFRLPATAPGSPSVFRIRPAPAVALAVVVAGLLANLLVSQVMDVDYTRIGETVDNLLRGIVASTGAMAIVLLAAVTWLGWWQPVWRQRPKASARWTWLVPIGMLLALTFAYLSTLGTQRTFTYLLTLVFAAMLVGLAEELAFRGVLVVGLRERFGEGWVWFLSSALFGLAHAGNALNGQDLTTTAFQVVLTFMIGTVLYVVRMATGTLLVPIILHGLWDIAAISVATSDQINPPISGLSNIFQWLTIILAFFAVRSIVRQARTVDPAGDQAPSAAT